MSKRWRGPKRPRKKNDYDSYSRHESWDGDEPAPKKREKHRRKHQKEQIEIITLIEEEELVE